MAALRPNLTARAVALVVVLLILVISFASSLRIYYAQAHEIAATQAQITASQERIAALQGELGRWDDAAYIRTQARERLGWVVPGETGFKVVGADGKPLGGGVEITSEAAPAPVTPADAWYAKLWGSVAAADDPTPAPDPADAPPITVNTRPSPSPSASASGR
ncbi:MAG: hypothetical protein JWP61_2042 [Friedmanniella sp.]|nr:hypothetical protein [Friedmanniella sp.]